jgi:hypothetical protein
MRLNDNDLDLFCNWLCECEHAIVGRPGMTFHCPLARWISEITGHTYGDSVAELPKHVQASKRSGRIQGKR